MRMEPLEDRRLLAYDLELVGVQPNGDAFLEDGDVRNVAPTSLRFLFSPTQEIDPNSLGGIQVTRAGGDGAFGDTNDVVIQPGYIGIGAAPNEVILRFAQALPDDDYQIDVLGTGPTPLLNIDGTPFNNGVDQRLRFQLDLGPQVLAVVPQPMVVRPDGTLGQNANEIVVYFNDDDLYVPDAENRSLYQLIYTADTAGNLDDVVFLPDSVAYDSVADRAVLTFSDNITRLTHPDTGLPIGAGTFRLRIGTDEATPLPPLTIRPAEDVGSSYQTAWDLGELGSRSQLISSSIDAHPFLLDFPGGNDEPGHRQIPEEVAERFDNHLNPNFGADSTPGITTILYNFKEHYGTDTQGQPLSNVITETQKLRAREALQVWSEFIGVQFLETGDVGLTIVTGDPRALDPDDPDVVNHVLQKAPVNAHFIARVDPSYENGLLILDNARQWNAEFGGDWYETVMIGIGFLLGLERATDLPPSTLMAFGSDFTYPGAAESVVAVGSVTGPPAAGAFNGNNLLANTDNAYTGFYLRFLNGALAGQSRLIINYTGNDRRFTFVTPFPVAPDAGNRFEIYPVPEPVFPGNHDILHGLFLHRADSNDIDMYRFSIGEGQSGRFTAEIFAERQPNASLLDSHLMLYQEMPDGARELIARNDDYFGRDSFVELSIGAGTYFLGVTAAGNDAYNAEFENTGYGGKSQGVYDLRIDFRADVAGDNTIRNVTADGLPGVSLDGDADGSPGGVHNFWFRAVEPENLIIVDKFARPFESAIKGKFYNIADALLASRPGDVVRIVPNGGIDNDLNTLRDNFGFEIGPGPLAGQILADGKTLDVPRGVTVMADAGVIFKLNQARIGVGSSSLSVDRSGGVFQALGTPDRPVYFTSYFDESIGLDTYSPTTSPRPGNWGGIVFRNDNDNAEERFNYEREGIFLNYVNQADIRFGGGNVVVESQPQIVTPIQMLEARPTVTFNRITLSADAPISADPNSFEETSFHAPRYQLRGAFTADYRRVGPDLHGNLLVENSSNGLFIRISTPAGDQQKALTLPGRFDDTDIVHVLSENLRIEGRLGQPILEVARPPVQAVTLTRLSGGSMEPATYHYKIVNVDRNGFEGRPSEATLPVTVSGTNRSVRLNGLPAASGDFIARRIYRSTDGVAGPYVFVAQINTSDAQFVDRASISSLDVHNTLNRDVPTVRGVTLTATGGGSGTLAAGTYNYRVTYFNSVDGIESPASDATANRVLAADGEIELRNLTRPNADGYDTIRIYRSGPDASGPYYQAGEIPATETTFVDLGETLDLLLNPVSFGVARARPAARLSVDPGVIVKLAGSRIETGFGSQLIAEGQPGREIIFTSLSDNRFGAGGTFNTFGESAGQGPVPGDWGGLYVGHIGSASIDHALLTYGGGVTKIEGTFKAFNILEIHQADVRLTNSVIEHNAEGTAGQGPANRFGRGTNEPATIFIRGAQPIIVNNVIQNNAATAITINANSFTSDRLPDIGRSTGHVALTGDYPGNRGPLIRENRMWNNPLNALDIRGEVLTTWSVWDDTDIVHVLRNQIIIPDFHSNVGLLLKSSPSASLVVKLDGPGDNFDPALGAGFTATGRQLDIRDRIGGTMHIVGQPDFPVILTSLKDDSVGAGTMPNGRTLTDTNNDGSATSPRPGDWRSVRFEQFANDRNVELIVEAESTRAPAPGVNATPATGQFLGELASSEFGGDENLRLGFHILGVLNEPNDIDVYSFNAAAGTEVWLDIDRTVPTLDTVVELLDSDGRVVARSTNSMLESQIPGLLYRGPGVPPEHVNPLQKAAPEFQPLHASGLPKDHFSTNPADAGMRVVLPGVVGVRSSYHVRVRSVGHDIHDLEGGLTSGSYELQIRLRETDEIPGVTVRYANIRYATNGIELYGLPGHSPLLGEVAEDEDVGGPETNNQVFPTVVPAAGPQNIGNLLASDRSAISIAGNIRTLDDVDLYEMQLMFEATTGSWFQHASVVFDVDYASGLSRPDTIVSVFDSFGRLVLIGRESNVTDDRSGPFDAGSFTDLSRGSLGALDPFIGPVQMPEGTYFVAITSNARIPTQLLGNPDLRLEPVNTITRVAEDRIGSFGGSTAGDPQVQTLLDNASILPVDPLEIPFYVLHDPGEPDESLVSVVDLLTGEVLRTVGPYPGKVLDLATRGDGGLYTFSAPDTDATDANTGLFQGVSTVTPQLLAGRDDGIRTYQANPSNPSVAILADVGIRFHAVTFGVLEGVERLLAVGSRGDAQDPPPGPTRFTNLLYQFDPRTGRAISAPQLDRTGNARLQGAGTQIVERGQLDTNVSNGPGGLIVGLAIVSEQLFALSETGGVFRVDAPLSNAASLTYLGDVVSPAGVIAEVEPNNSLPTAQDLDLEIWTLRYDPDIGDQDSNTSTSIKHITIHGRGDDPFIDFFVRGDSGGLDQPTGSTVKDNYFYVASNGTNEILRYDLQTGQFVDVFVSAGSGGLSGPREIMFNPNDGHLLVASFGTDSVLRYDGQTGAFINAFIPTGSNGLDGPAGMVFHADGSLLVSSFNTHQVLRFRATNGQFMGTFVGANSGGLVGPHGLTFGPDGDLYLVSRGTNSILRYNSSGAFREVFVPPGAGGLALPNLGLRFGPDGHLYASSGGSHLVARYHATSGAPLGAYVGAGADSLNAPWGLLFDSAGNLFVNSFGNDRVLLYNDDVVEDTWQWQSEVTAGSGVRAGDRAGTMVDLSDDRMVVGAPLDDARGADAGAVYVYVRHDAGTPDDLRDDQWQLQQKLFASDAAAGDHFGTAVALDGDLLAVSAVRKDVVIPEQNGTPEQVFPDQGVIYVFRWDGTSWNEQAILTASDSQEGLLLGRELAAQLDPLGDTIVATAPVDVMAAGFVTSATPAVDSFDGDDALSDVDDFYNGMFLRFESGALAGQARLITDYAGGNRTFTFGIPFPAAPAENDTFEVLPAESGSAYVFRYDGSQWFEQVKLLPSDSALLDMFGRGVALDAGQLMIGAPNANAGIGSVYRFVRDDQGTADPSDDTWPEVEPLRPREGTINDKFGWSVALQGNRAVVGALRDDAGAPNGGSVYVFEYLTADAIWEEGAKLLAPDAAANDRFGERVALDGATVVVGAPDGDMGVANSGSAYVFQVDDRGTVDIFDDIWTMVGEIGASHAAPENVFGTSVAIQGDHIVVGDPEWDFRGVDAGTAQVFVFAELAQATFETFFIPFGTGGLSRPEQITVGPDGRLYVVSANTNRILRFDAETGAFIDVFIEAGDSGLDQPQSLAFGPDSNDDGVPEIFVTSRGTDEVLRFDGATGAFIDVFASLGLDQPTGLTFGPDRTDDGVPELYVSGFASNNVVEFDGASGAFRRQLIPPGQGQLNGPMHLEFRPDGRLYVASANNNSIRRYNAQTGAFVSAFVAPGLGGLNSPRYFVFGPDVTGNGDPELYVSSFGTNSVLQYNGRNGTFIGEFVHSGNEGLAGPTGLTFNPDGYLLVADSVNDTIMRFDTSGTPTFDFFKFTVENAGDRGIFDIDYGWVDGDPGSFDAMIFVLDAGGNVIASNDDADIEWGAGEVSTIGIRTSRWCLKSRASTT
jgi:DNA-binding beta-propeller fold protein YncE